MPEHARSWDRAAEDPYTGLMLRLSRDFQARRKVPLVMALARTELPMYWSLVGRRLASPPWSSEPSYPVHGRWDARGAFTQPRALCSIYEGTTSL